MDSGHSYQREVSAASIKRHSNNVYDESIDIGEPTDADIQAESTDTRSNDAHNSIMQRLQSSKGIRAAYYKNESTDVENESHDEYEYNPNDMKNVSNEVSMATKRKMVYSSKGLKRNEKNLHDENTLNEDVVSLEKNSVLNSKMTENSSNEAREFEESEEDDSNDEETSSASTPVSGAYNPLDYQHLSVSSEISDLFQLIKKYSPESIELVCILKPFIPEYMPSIGDADYMLKIPRPDLQNDFLGITVLDEPSLVQSDPSILQLKLEQKFKRNRNSLTDANSQDGITMPIKILVFEEEHTKKAIQNWVSNIQDIHSSQPPPTVHYTRIMPSLDDLMQDWPYQVKQVLNEHQLSVNPNAHESNNVEEKIGAVTGNSTSIVQSSASVGKDTLCGYLDTFCNLIPNADLNTSIDKYVDIICCIADIPVYAKSRTQSLHLLFSLYLSIKEHISSKNHGKRFSLNKRKQY